MALSHRNYAKVRVVAPVGRLDHDNCETFRNDLAPRLDACLREGQALIFDLSGLEYVSSAGLRCLMLAARQAVSRSGRLVIASLQPLVAEIFQISRFNLVFDVFPTMREALASVSSEAVEAFERGGSGMGLRVWGTRGSLPAALPAAVGRGKLAQALVAAGRRR